MKKQTKVLSMFMMAALAFGVVACEKETGLSEIDYELLQGTWDADTVIVVYSISGVGADVDGEEGNDTLTFKPGEVPFTFNADSTLTFYTVDPEKGLPVEETVPITISGGNITIPASCIPGTPAYFGNNKLAMITTTLNETKLEMENSFNLSIGDLSTSMEVKMSLTRE